MSAPLAVPVLTRDVINHVREAALSMPYRSSVGIDPARIVWIEVGGLERIGVAYTADDPDGPHWMIALLRLDGRQVGKSSIRRVVEMLLGTPGSWELAPPLASAPLLTLVRVKADEVPLSTG